jgi:hypothetical protein
MTSTITPSDRPDKTWTLEKDPIRSQVHRKSAGNAFRLRVWVIFIALVRLLIQPSAALLVETTPQKSPEPDTAMGLARTRRTKAKSLPLDTTQQDNRPRSSKRTRI